MITDSYIIFIIMAMGVLTFCTRLSFIWLVGQVDMPVYFQQALRFAPVAVLSALVIPAITFHQGIPDISAGNERLISGIVAILVIRFTGNVLLTITVGMATLWILQAALS